MTEWAPLPEERLLAKMHPELVAELRGGLDATLVLPLVLDLAPGTADAGVLTSLGAQGVRPVAVHERGRYGVATEALPEHGTTSDTWIVHAPARSLRFLATLPWVIAIAPAIEWPLLLPPEVERRLDIELTMALRQYGPERLYAIEGLAEIDGRLDASRVAELSSLGVVLHCSIDAQACNDTIFEFTAPLDMVPRMAGLPWIVRMEGPQPIYPQ